MINKAGCECLNESDDHPFTQALSSSGGFLESDTDEQVRMAGGMQKQAREDWRHVGCVVGSGEQNGGVRGVSYERTF